MKTPRPYVLQENNWKDVKDRSYTTAVLPWGATEAHNYHLPYGTDNYLAEHAAIQAASMAWEKGARAIVLPVVPFGVNTGQLDVPLCVNMNPSTQLAVLKDIVHMLELQNINKLVIINAHGGNTFKPIIRELSALYPKVFVCALNWWQAKDGKAFFDSPGDHAGELETSAMMHLQPELVLSLEQAGDGKAKKFKIPGLNTWITTQRKWTSVTQDTGVGDPSKSTAEKGAAFFKAATQVIGEFLVELHQVDPDNMYE